MPKNYSRTSQRAIAYSQKDLETAVEKVRKKELTNYAASKLYGIPASTLSDRVNGKTGLKSRTLGRSPAIPLGSYIYDQWMADQNEEYDFEVAYASSKRGWMETEIFYNYMVKVIIPSLGEERPVLLIYDGHSTHVDERVVALAAENNITILKLPAHISYLLQPLDLAVFKSFKSIWDKNLWNGNVKISDLKYVRKSLLKCLHKHGVKQHQK
ncbi:unnamed protein product [Parnassius apollo]|uniref:(apollo) hypothetical protein n=1 Tax=Parnassius apollo TaxID=110799 RepID=A0A8S3Y5H7_PARAO|nr:unnamed protein product [Parnassius apollo]